MKCCTLSPCLPTYTVLFFLVKVSQTLLFFDSLSKHLENNTNNNEHETKQPKDAEHGGVDEDRVVILPLLQH